MNVQTVSNLQKPFTEVVVTDSISKKQYFVDSETVGWLLLGDGSEAVTLFHLYRRGYSQQNSQVTVEYVIFPDEPITGSQRDKEIATMLSELNMQQQSGENTELLERVTNLIK